MTNGNPTKGGHKQDGKSNPCTLLFQNICPLHDIWMIQGKNQSILDSEVSCWVHCQSTMFDPPFHNLSHGKHNKHVWNPLNNNGTSMKFHQTFWNIIHIPKGKWTDPRNFQAWTWEELLVHPQVSYKTKLWYETFEMPYWENFPL